MAERPEILKHKVFEKIFEVTALMNMDDKTRSKISRNMTTERDRINQDRYAREVALAEGRAEGRAEGEMSKANEIAAKLLATGMTKTEVAAIVGLDETEF